MHGLKLEARKEAARKVIANTVVIIHDDDDDDDLNDLRACLAQMQAHGGGELA